MSILYEFKIFMFRTYFPAGAAFILALSFEYFPNHKNASKWRDLAREQIDYLAGQNTKQSFIVGYGDRWPTQPQHKGSSCPRSFYPCGEEYKNKNRPNPQVNLLIYYKQRNLYYTYIY